MPQILPLKTLCLLPAAVLLLAGCVPSVIDFEPNITYTPTEQLIAKLPSPFGKLTKSELQQEWARELYIGLHFGNELDLYRAITAFKRALFLLPANQAERKLQLEYYVYISYYLGKKYQEALNYFQKTRLDSVSQEFPAFKDLLISLYDCYLQTEQEDKANLILKSIECIDPDLAARLKLSSYLEEGAIDAARAFSAAVSISDTSCGDLEDFLDNYNADRLSVSKAKTLNALLPGAGYYYVGQKKTAGTALLVNALFTWAAYSFFKNGYVAAGAVTTSLEMGWYLGGINGAGLAANEYNERLYETRAKDFMIEHRLFPILLLETSF